MARSVPVIAQSATSLLYDPSGILRAFIFVGQDFPAESNGTILKWNVDRMSPLQLMP